MQNEANSVQNDESIGSKHEISVKAILPANIINKESPLFRTQTIAKDKNVKWANQLDETDKSMIDKFLEERESEDESA